jgi:hypothetical protein
MPERPDWARAMLEADIEVKRCIFAVMLPDISDPQFIAIKRRERAARERRRVAIEEIKRELRKPEQLGLPLPRKDLFGGG